MWWHQFLLSGIWETHWLSRGFELRGHLVDEPKSIDDFYRSPYVGTTPRVSGVRLKYLSALRTVVGYEANNESVTDPPLGANYLFELSERRKLLLPRSAQKKSRKYE
jgi:hypothetical protein